MKSELLSKFPKYLRYNSNNIVEFAWGIDNVTEFEQENLTMDSGIYERFQVPGSLKQLVILNEDFDSLFPVEDLAKYSAVPQAIIDIIADWVKQAVRFERFDLVSVNRSQRRFNFEYSIGVDVEGVIHTAYKGISESSLGWIFVNEQSYLVENFTPDTHRFSEDPQLYQTGFRSILRVPIIFNQGVIGVILLGSMEPEQYQLEDALLLQNLAQTVAQAFFLAGVQQEQEYNTLASSTLLQTVVSMSQVRETTEFLNAYCQTLKQLAKTDRVGLFLVDEQEDKYNCIAEAGKKLATVGEWLPISRLPFRAMLKSKSIVAFNLGDPRYGKMDELLGRGLTAALYAPIADSQGRIIACLGTASADESALSKEMAGLFKAASEQLSYIMSQSISDISDNKKNEQDITEKPQGFEEIIGSSKIMQDTIQKAVTVSQYEFPILLLGETGTGKELFAKAIHRSSAVSKGPFIVVNSAAIPDNLLESELFGYKEGAFTGGLKGGKKGKILLAHGGTLFLDEIGELSLELQAKLLRVIQEKEVEPLGSEKPIPIEVRIISATHRNLKEMVKNQEFREDLYYRLNSIEIQIPPLKERGKDIIELAESMLEDLAKRNGKRTKRLSNEATQALLDCDCPGNVRQLQNLINWAFAFADGDIIKIEDLPPEMHKNIKEKVDHSEVEELSRLLEEFKGNKTALANYLGMTRTGLWKKLKRLGL